MTGAGGDIDVGGAVSICPHCGYDLEKDAPVEYGRLSYDPRIGVMLDGKRLKMGSQLHDILATLMRDPGKVFKKIILTERMGYEGEDDKYVDVRICQLRRRLREAGLPDLIATVWGVGVAFDPAPLLETPVTPPAAGRTSGSRLGASATTSTHPFLHSDHRVASKEVV